MSVEKPGLTQRMFVSSVHLAERSAVFLAAAVIVDDASLTIGITDAIFIVISGDSQH
jgi:hypothetical protein